MPRYLVVANQTLGGQHLEHEIGKRLAAGRCSFHVVVPATPSSEHATWVEGEAKLMARERLDAALARFRALGAEADGEVGDGRPLLAIGDALRHGNYDEIILSTLPAGASRWLKLDLLHRVERQFDVPVTHVVAAPEEARVGGDRAG